MIKGRKADNTMNRKGKAMRNVKSYLWNSTTLAVGEVI